MIIEYLKFSNFDIFPSGYKSTWSNNLNRMNVEPGLSLRVPSSTKYAVGG